MTTWQIPVGTLRWVQRAPIDRPVAMLIRHSVRPPLPADGSGHLVPLTATGVQLAQDLGARLGSRVRSLHASPTTRCMQTAEAIASGAGVGVPVVLDHLLGHPGAYVVDGRAASRLFVEFGHETLMDRLMTDDDALPGMAAPEPAARFLTSHLLQVAGDLPGLHVFVTHDLLVTTTVSRLWRTYLAPERWPHYLEAAFFWRAEDGVQVAYHDNVKCVGPGPMCGFDETDVVELARREVGATVGFDSGARFFFAGGAFKTLLTSRPPRDLDVWGATPADRQLVVDALLARGAVESAAPPFGQAFRINGRVIEVPTRAEPPELEARLARFDIGLSAVGVEVRPGGGCRAVVHPLARESVRRREVLLLKPLVNWKYALATLHRARRYALELGFALTADEETEVWRIFDSQPPDAQDGMLRRLRLCVPDAERELEEASRRRR